MAPKNVDVENLSVSLTNVIKIIIAVAIIVSAGVAIQYQITDNTARIEKLEVIQKHKVGQKQFKKFKLWVEEEI